MNYQIDKYKITGKIYVWKFRENQRNFPGWNLTVNDECAMGLNRLFELMEQSEFPSKKSIKTTTPTYNQLRVPNNLNGKAKWESKPTITLNYKKYENENLWEIIEEDDRIELRFGTAKMKELKKGINGIPKGEGDYGICDDQDENIFNFWWNLEK